VIECDSLENNVALLDYATIYVWSLKEYRNPVERVKHKLEPVHLPPAPLPVKKGQSNNNANSPQPTSQLIVNSQKSSFVASPFGSLSLGIEQFPPVSDQNGFESMQLKADAKEFTPQLSSFMPFMFGVYGSSSYFLDENEYGYSFPAFEHNSMDNSSVYSCDAKLKDYKF
jgi:hypothetical protein